MKTIFLLRHAKSSWDDVRLDDFDRPLSSRGIKSCKKMGKYLKKNRLIPDIVYCSSAIRAKQTWELVNRIVEKKENVIYEDSLYMSDFSNFINIIKKTKNNFKNLMIVSHNPGIENLALELSKDKNNEIYEKINIKFPTGALIIINFNLNNWSKVDCKKGKLYEFVKPKEL
jgi:phosphohistidine phosphatase